MAVYLFLSWLLLIVCCMARLAVLVLWLFLEPWWYIGITLCVSKKLSNCFFNSSSVILAKGFRLFTGRKLSKSVFDFFFFSRGMIRDVLKAWGYFSFLIMVLNR